MYLRGKALCTRAGTLLFLILQNVSRMYVWMYVVFDVYYFAVVLC
jgi:hypothetical protein